MPELGRVADLGDLIFMGVSVIGDIPDIRVGIKSHFSTLVLALGPNQKQKFVHQMTFSPEI